MVAVGFSDGELLAAWELLREANAVWQALGLGQRFKAFESQDSVNLATLSTARKPATLRPHEGQLLLGLLRRPLTNHRQQLLSLQAAARLETALAKATKAAKE